MELGKPVFFDKQVLYDWVDSRVSEPKSDDLKVPAGAAIRKSLPVCTGVLDYFPDALLAVADLSKKGSNQHHPGKPVHWDKAKSTDEADALMRHLIDRGKIDADGVRHSTKVAWRGLALLQRELDAEATA